MAKIWEEQYHEDTIQKRCLTQTDIEFLKTLQKEINTQGRTAETLPSYFVIRDYKHVYGNDLDDPEGICIKYYSDWETIYEGEKPDIDEINELAKTLVEYFDKNYLDHKYDKTVELFEIEELFAMFEGIYTMEYQETIVDTHMFLTQHAAQAFLKDHADDFSEKAHTYHMFVQENTESQLFTILKELDFDTILNEKSQYIQQLLKRKSELELTIKETTDAEYCQSLKIRWNEICNMLDQTGYTTPESDLDGLINSLSNN